MATVELLYFPDCPHIAAAREQLHRALVVCKLPEVWTEVDVTAPGATERVRRYGSPTILVDGVDVVGATAVEGAACRVYVGSDLKGAPPLQAIVAALQRRWK